MSKEPALATDDGKLKLEVYFLLRKLKAHAEMYNLNEELTLDILVMLCCEMLKASETRVRNCFAKLQEVDHSIKIDRGYVRIR